MDTRVLSSFCRDRQRPSSALCVWWARATLPPAAAGSSHPEYACLRLLELMPPCLVKGSDLRGSLLSPPPDPEGTHRSAISTLRASFAAGGKSAGGWAAGGGGVPVHVSRIGAGMSERSPPRHLHQKTDQQQHEGSPVWEEPPPQAAHVPPHTRTGTPGELGGQGSHHPSCPLPPLKNPSACVCWGGQGGVDTCVFLSLNQEGRVSWVICWLRAPPPGQGTGKPPPQMLLLKRVPAPMSECDSGVRGGCGLIKSRHSGIGS